MSFVLSSITPLETFNAHTHPIAAAGTQNVHQLTGAGDANVLNASGAPANVSAYDITSPNTEVCDVTCNPAGAAVCVVGTAVTQRPALIEATGAGKVASPAVRSSDLTQRTVVSSVPTVTGTPT